MTDEILQETSKVLAKPYATSRSRLGITSKVLTDKFVCREQKLHSLVEQVTEKITSLSPINVGFQYLVSFQDRTHLEHHDLNDLGRFLSTTDKETERVVLKWNFTYALDGREIEATVIVRMTDPINPLLVVQAALSKSPEDIDNLEFENGSVCVSVDGCGHTYSQELFEIVGKWVNSCPHPESISNTNEWLVSNSGLIQFSNYWLLPLLASVGYLLLILGQSNIELMVPMVFIGLVGYNYLRTFAQYINRKITVWTRKSSLISIFDLTSGDSNKQNRLAARARKSGGKLLGTALFSLLLDILAGIAVAMLM